MEYAEVDVKEESVGMSRLKNRIDEINPYMGSLDGVKPVRMFGFPLIEVI